MVENSERKEPKSLGEIWTERAKANVSKGSFEVEVIKPEEIESIREALSERVKNKLKEIGDIQDRLNRAGKLKARNMEREKIAKEILGDRVEGVNKKVINWTVSFLKFAQNPDPTDKNRYKNRFWLMLETQNRLYEPHAPTGMLAGTLSLCPSDIDQAIALLTSN